MKKATLFYDGDCYFCDKYSKLQELRECIDLQMVSARDNLSWKEIDKNLNLDDGVILILNDSKKIYQGVEAIKYLENICKFESLIFKIQKLVFSNRFFGNLAYGMMKILRKISLKSASK